MNEISAMVDKVWEALAAMRSALMCAEHFSESLDDADIAAKAALVELAERARKAERAS